MTYKTSILLLVLLTTCVALPALPATDNQILQEYLALKANHTQADEMTLAMGADELTLLKASEQTMPCLHHMVHNLATKLKIAMPEIRVFECTSAVKGFNAFALALYHNLGIIAIGLGLIKYLLPAELEAVIAHELSHVSGNHSLKKLGALALLSRPIGLKPFIVTQQAVDDVLQGLVINALSRHHERQADQSAATIIDDPQNLVRALEKIEKITGNQKNDHKPGAFQKALNVAKSFFSSHPSTKARKKYLTSLARKKPKN